MQRGKPNISPPIQGQPQWQAPPFQQPQTQCDWDKLSQWQHQKQQAQQLQQPHCPPYSPPHFSTPDLYPKGCAAPPQAHMPALYAQQYQQPQHRDYGHVAAPPQPPPQQIYPVPTPYPQEQGYVEQVYQHYSPSPPYQPRAPSPPVNTSTPSPPATKSRAQGSTGKPLSKVAGLDSPVLESPVVGSAAASTLKGATLDSRVSDVTPIKVKQKKKEESKGLEGLEGFEDIDLGDA